MTLLLNHFPSVGATDCLWMNNLLIIKKGDVLDLIVTME